MGHYKSNLRDIEFNLFEVFGADKALGQGPFADLDVDSAKDVLREAERLASNDLAASFTDSDRNPPVFDKDAGTVAMPRSFLKSWQAYHDGGWDRFPLDADLGGMGASPSLIWAFSEMVLGSNPAIYMFAAGPAFAQILHKNGTPDQKRFAELAIERGWGATMVLTEPDAGSDVGAGRATARQQPDGTWHIEGVKRFITSAEWDWPENIFHLVLARPVGVEGKGGPGTKGLSLFLVPKFQVDLETGEIGERNGAYVTNVEKKMGLKVSTTCEVTFGEKQPAVGTLVGDLHDGIAQMFQVIEYARMMVGTKAISTLSTGYLNALEYAKQRVQGSDLAKMTDKTAPRVTITHHPDVRLMLMRQKAWAEGMRALVLYTASVQDQVELSRHAGEVDEAAVRLNDLLLPIVKGYGSEKAYELLATSLQVFGGSGFTQDYPIEQYIRDAKIDTLYEGTTTIQGMDFFFRKIVRDQGSALGKLTAEIQEFAKGDRGNGALTKERELLGTALDDCSAIVTHMVNDLMSSVEQTDNVYKVGLNTTRVLMALGDLVIGWLLLRQAAVALDALPAASARDKAFYEGKVAAAKWFAAAVFPSLTSARAIAEATDLSLMELDEAAF
ncbi:MAG: acyl-CoA dehydrogenase protein [Frankiales bacterium]|nr:acyl-CoA dehydrogenase protein [Frankiales bacterium]